VVLIVAPLLGVFLDRALFRPLEGQPQIISIIATVGLFVLFRGIAQLIWKGETKSVQSLFPSGVAFHLPGGATIPKDSLGIFIVRAREIAQRASRNTRGLVTVVFFAFLALVPVLFSGSWRDSVYQGFVYAIIFISLVILTGYSGQISFGQTAFMGIAAFTTAHLVQGAHVPMWVAMVLGPLAAVPAGNLIGFIAVRVHGLYLALMTLAFAFMADSLFFQNPTISGGEGGIHVGRPAGFHGPTSLFYMGFMF